ncbi:hypothetical protein [Chitinophaga lutea]|uniref:hypothetical protein n=1 Tax=Chitinophaga lutea TaxID=2488634 RepID=UPI000F4FBDDA|nr:hypothetical protein [Chitinophaga lutea]
MKRLIPLLLSAFLCGSAAAQTRDFSSAVSMQFLAAPSNYLKPLDTLRLLAPSIGNDPWQRYLFCNDMATYSSFVGDYHAALRYYDSLPVLQQQPRPVPVPSPGDFDGYQTAGARQTIVRMAASRQVTMINESHHLPYHRLFTKSLLQDLYNAGYRYLALEALAGLDDSINTRRYPTSQDGYYIVEPLFADMLRTALTIGYQLVRYEDDVPCTKNCRAQRELNQAKNLYKIFRQDPAAKVLVHAGYSHILEKEREGLQRMAGHFRTLSGIDPLTVNQNIMNEKSEAAYEDKYFIAFSEAHAISEPVVLVKDANVWVSPADKGFFDIQVFHPRFKTVHGRPGYYALDRTRKPVSVTLRRDYNDMLLQAFAAEEGHANAVPVDQMVLNGQHKPSLMLPPGEYRIVVRDVTGKVVEEIKLP